MRYPQNDYPAVLLCRTLGVGRSSYYAWSQLRHGARKIADKALSSKIKACFEASDETYGAERIYQDLQEAGIRCGRSPVDT